MFYEDGLNFECKKCSFCCGHSPGFVYLSRFDLERLCKFFNITTENFIEKYCRIADYYGGTRVFALKEKKNFDCILWDGGCSAYSARPVQCSTYPFWSWMLKDSQTWQDCAKDCPGMNCGKKWSKEEIENAERKYALNRPMKIEELLLNENLLLKLLEK